LLTIKLMDAMVKIFQEWNECNRKILLLIY